MPMGCAYAPTGYGSVVIYYTLTPKPKESDSIKMCCSGEMCAKWTNRSDTIMCQGCGSKCTKTPAIDIAVISVVKVITKTKFNMCITMK